MYNFSLQAVKPFVLFLLSSFLVLIYLKSKYRKRDLSVKLVNGKTRSHKPKYIPN